jgi:hypothetical protein
MSLIAPLEREYILRQLRQCRRAILVASVAVWMLVAFYLFGWFRLYFSDYVEPYRTWLLYNYASFGAVYAMLMLISRRWPLAGLLIATIIFVGAGIWFYPGIKDIEAQAVVLVDIIVARICIRGVLYAWEYQSLKKQLSSLPDEQE